MNKQAISIQNICFSYDKRPIYQDFSLNIPENDIFFLMGVNGCGKTTLLKILCSFLTVSKGSITVLGKPLSDFDSKALGRTISYVPQTINLNSDFLVKDYLALGRTPYKGFYSVLTDEDYQIVESVAVQLGASDLLDAEFNSLSGGQKQIIAIGRALVQDTPIIVLDEPMSALDLGHQAEFLELLVQLKRSGKTIILTSHNPNHAGAVQNLCTICLLTNGSIAGLGHFRQVFTEDTLRAVFGERVQLDSNAGNISFKLNIE